MIRTPASNRPVLVSSSHLAKVADRHNVGTTIVDGYEYAVVRWPGRDYAAVFYAPCPEAVA